MAEEGTLCINADVLKAAGANASSVSVAEGYTNVYILEAEGFVCVSSRYDWITNYASVSAIGKEFLRQITAALAAIEVMKYNPSGYTSKSEFQTMVDINYSVVVEGINLLRDDNFRNFVLNGTA
jgi:hypothetical protein